MRRRRPFPRWRARRVRREYAAALGLDALTAQRQEARERFPCCYGRRDVGHAAGCRRGR